VTSSVFVPRRVLTFACSFWHPQIHCHLTRALRLVKAARSSKRTYFFESQWRSASASNRDSEYSLETIGQGSADE
jgi:hypothetical protein